MATVVESAGTDGRLVLVKYDDGTILLIDRDNFTTYDNLGDTNNDNIIDLEDLKDNHVNESGIYAFTDSTGGSFDINTINTRNDLVLTRDDGTTYVFDVTQIETYEDYDGAANDNRIDIDEIANNVDNNNIVQFVDSSGGGFTLQPGSGQNTDEFMIVKDDGTVLQVEAADFLNSTLDPNSDGVVDVDSISPDGTNIWEWYDSTGAAFEVVGNAATDNSVVFARADGTKLVVDVDNNNTYDDLGSTNNDGRIDIEALSNNTDSSAIFEFYDSTGGDFTLMPLNGDNTHFAVMRDDGTAFMFRKTSIGAIDTNDGTDDGRIDVSEFINNVNSDTIYQVIDSSGEPFAIAGGADDTDYDDVHFARANGELITVRFDTIESDADRLAGDANDNVIDLANLSANVGSMGSGFKYNATIEGAMICFARGTMIRTPDGEKAIEDLVEGDLVETVDHGAQELRWIGSHEVSGMGKLAPITIKAGTFGARRDLTVSPQHRVLVSDWRVDLLFDETEVLVAAKHLVDGDSVFVDRRETVEYFHMLFDTHEVVFSNGARTESFHPGEVGFGAMSEESREEVFEIFPELRANVASYGEPARMVVKGYESRILVEGLRG